MLKHSIFIDLLDNEEPNSYVTPLRSFTIGSNDDSDKDSEIEKRLSSIEDKLDSIQNFKDMLSSESAKVEDNKTPSMCYSPWSGADIVCIYDNKVIGTITNVVEARITHYMIENITDQDNKYYDDIDMLGKFKAALKIKSDVFKEEVVFDDDKDLILVFCNEYGQKAWQIAKGLCKIQDNMAFGIDSVSIPKISYFAAQSISPINSNFKLSIIGTDRFKDIKQDKCYSIPADLDNTIINRCCIENTLNNAILDSNFFIKGYCHSNKKDKIDYIVIESDKGVHQKIGTKKEE